MTEEETQLAKAQDLAVTVTTIAASMIITIPDELLSSVCDIPLQKNSRGENPPDKILVAYDCFQKAARVIRTAKEELKKIGYEKT